MPTDSPTDDAAAEAETPEAAPAKKVKKAAAKRRPARKAVGAPRTSSALAKEGTDPTPAQALAGEILDARWDLLPSVERIAAAALPDDGVVDALTLFRDSLTAVGDPNRDPRVAIAAAEARAAAR